MKSNSKNEQEEESAFLLESSLVYFWTLKRNHSAGYLVYNPEGHTVYRLRVSECGGEENMVAVKEK
jgi:hypothetical protein